MTTKVPDTKGCLRCCVGRNPYNGYKYLCGAMPNSVFLMQWYDPLNKFMLLKVWDIVIMTEGLNGLQSSLLPLPHGITGSVWLLGNWMKLVTWSG